MLIKYVTIHAAATYPSMDIDVDWIKSIHVNQNGWSDVGYHFFIKRDGELQKGRSLDRTGAHVGNNNTGNIGVCMAGGLKEGTKEPEDNFTDQQWITLNKLLADICESYPQIVIMGHNGFKGYESRGCPCFDWKSYREWFVGVQKSLYKPDDWYGYDWHVHQSEHFNLPKDFYSAVDKTPKEGLK